MRDIDIAVHETGHLLVALHYGFTVHEVVVSGEERCVRCDPPGAVEGGDIATWPPAALRCAMVQLAAGYAAGMVELGQGLGLGYRDQEEGDWFKFDVYWRVADALGATPEVGLPDIRDALREAGRILQAPPWRAALRAQAFPALLLDRRRLSGAACAEALQVFGVTAAHIGQANPLAPGAPVSAPAPR
ncbi:MULTISPECIES: hypothetical protein [Deinococcus]|nr:MULTISPECIES: hypothetical protein [Deinococcus]RIX96748.1 hypothetical protein D3W47_19785 [Deinococcus sp. RM]